MSLVSFVCANRPNQALESSPYLFLYLTDRFFVTCAKTKLKWGEIHFHKVLTTALMENKNNSIQYTSEKL